ncbi:thiosulfate oxidation carrier complex protein SoxZ [Roseiterribacter gracilis]|uniref:Thiosulfate oxidation carrier complex protein SoxZ n=1 Tax=Roseiterribacter gracilis TaxID=2812848 RepID=A0A8S8XHX3_9PROT|nr:thiosulfate oxidation carrier complex protein SoxZ [Rhodospirillales bacterium TMPK1]
MARPLINVPAKAKKGEVVDIKILISHPMESGQRRDNSGQPIARDIINLLVCTYNDTEVFRAELFPAIAANPFLSFCTVATETGTLKFTWTDDHGTVDTATAPIEVT